MGTCVDCGGYSYTYYGSECLCRECRDKRQENAVMQMGESLTRPSDLKTWKKADMSELFWAHLGKYLKEPNEHSLCMMDMAYMWACHDDHGLSNSFRHALKWAKIDLYEESQKWEKENTVD